MRRILLASFAALCLGACTPAITGLSTIPAPLDLANRTAADEQIAVGAENGYKAFRLAVELGVDSGLIKGARATQLAAADQRAYAALLALRTAYSAGNSTNFLTAARSANSAIEQAISVVKGR